MTFDEVWENFQRWQKITAGTQIRHSTTGATAVVRCRKDDGTGWWLTDGGGIWDRLLLDGSWVVTGWSRPTAYPQGSDG